MSIFTYIDINPNYIYTAHFIPRSQCAQLFQNDKKYICSPRRDCPLPTGQFKLFLSCGLVIIRNCWSISTSFAGTFIEPAIGQTWPTGPTERRSGAPANKSIQHDGPKWQPVWHTQSNSIFHLGAWPIEILKMAVTEGFMIKIDNKELTRLELQFVDNDYTQGPFQRARDDDKHRKKFHALIRIFLGLFPRILDFFLILGILYHFLNLGKKLNLGSQTQNSGSKLGLAFSHFFIFSRNCFVLN